MVTAECMTLCCVPRFPECFAFIVGTISEVVRDTPGPDGESVVHESFLKRVYLTATLQKSLARTHT